MRGVTPRIDRISRAVAALASSWFAFAASWGMFGIPGSGHLGAGASGNVMAGEQMIRWKIIYPAWGWFTGVRPEPATSYICHHPFGQYYVPAILFWLFGHRDVLVHLPAVLMSMAIPPLLYGIAKERWGRPIGAVAAVGYVFVPIALGFSNFWNLETICIFGALLFFWGHSRHTTTRKRRYLVASLVGLGFACVGDWAGYLLVAPLLAWAFLRAFVFPLRLTPRFRLAPYARWWALSVILAVGTLVWWVALFHHAKMLTDWLNAGELRGGGVGTTLRATLDGRKSWIEFSFTPLCILVGKVAAPLALVRLVAKRTDEDAYALSLLFGAVVQYAAFPEGAEIHIFWPHYFAPYFALALAQLAATAGGVVGWMTRRLLRRPQRAPVVTAVVGLVLGLLPSLAMAHDGVKSLWVWRRTGGRYDDNGGLVRSNVDALYVVQKVVRPASPPGSKVDAHPGFPLGWEFVWSFQGEANTAASPVVAGPGVAEHPIWVARASGMSSDEQKRVAAAAHVRVYGDVWVVDQREDAAPLDAYSLNEREPSVLAWFFRDATEPTRSIGEHPDPWLTWEWRAHLGQPADEPAGEPQTLDELRIAHNVAVARGDAESAERRREQIERALDRTHETRFTRGLRLIGVRLTTGVEPRLESWFECAAAQPGDATFNVRSTVEGREPFSLIPPTPTDRQMSWATSLPTKLWHAGFLYTTSTVLNHRIGIERYWGSWQSRDGAPSPVRPAAPGAPSAPGETTLAVVR